MNRKIIAFDLSSMIEELFAARMGDVEIPDHLRDKVLGNGNQPGLMDLPKGLLKSLVSQFMSPEAVLSLNHVTPDNRVTPVLSPQLTYMDRDEFMNNLIVYKRFLDSQVPAVMTHLMEAEDEIREMLEQDGITGEDNDNMRRQIVDREFLHVLQAVEFENRHIMEPLRALFRKYRRTSVSMLEANPLMPYEKYVEDKDYYPGLNLIPSTLDPILSQATNNLPQDFIPDDIIHLQTQLKERGIDIKLVSLRNRTFMWPRDVISWIDDRTYIRSESESDYSSVSNGGAIVYGESKGRRFALVSERSHPEQIQWLMEHAEGIDIIPVHAGFITYKYKGELYHSGDIHIDNVLGFVPGRLTTDGRNKLLIDPQYMEMEFELMFAIAQEFDIDIIHVHRDELHLMMPNFWVVEDTVLINKGEKTIRALKLKPDAVVTPTEPDTGGIYGGGLYRCQSNSLPLDVLNRFDPVIESEAMDTRDIITWQHVVVFNGEKPHRDFLSDIVNYVEQHHIDRSIVYRAFREYARKNNDRAPSWISSGAVIEIIKEQHAAL